jgi:SAM-dependent methyltransferase
LALLFATEQCLEAAWASAPGLRFVRTDIDASRSVDLVADATRLPLRSGSLDVVWCHHVLSEVQDDVGAIRELGRVLRPSAGAAIVSVGMTGRANTEEYSSPNSMGWLRGYGADFGDRLASGGLVAEDGVDFGLSAAERAEYGVRPDVFYVCHKPADVPIVDVTGSPAPRARN